jgi:hypothetical protein
VAAVPGGASQGQNSIEKTDSNVKPGLNEKTDSNVKSETPAEQTQLPVPTEASVIGTRRADELPTARREYVVQILVEVKNGRVTDARVWNPRPGAGAYESIALKMAKERRYPDAFTGGERLKIRVKP